jgi:hypothetical protein
MEKEKVHTKRSRRKPIVKTLAPCGMGLGKAKSTATT